MLQATSFGESAAAESSGNPNIAALNARCPPPRTRKVVAEPMYSFFRENAKSLCVISLKRRGKSFVFTILLRGRCLKGKQKGTAQ
jgi:hypothetical protein